MAYENIIFEVKDPGVGLLTINRPKALNALNPGTLDEINDVIDTVEREGNVRVLVITGAGEKAFVAGADITEFPKMNALEAYLFALKGQKLFFRLEQLPVPVIACVNGFCLGGGCELAMSCDFIFASEKAKFGQPEINLGIIPGFGGTQRLARLVGRAKAKELCMTGEMISAEEARAIGLVARVFPADQLLEETLKVATALAQKSQIALRSIKKVIDEGVGVDLRSGCELEANAFGLVFTSEDAREGVNAFLEKRKAQFKGGFTA
ncbi:enoyl-CoA hydratase/isomerase family protein [Thermodesulforhabdus norvegica]|uniref:Short chain enoyl-CoA hydratase n=1 Tax=Thermodesulforhabdus norvegica TaxID=39841 RepID=A0A1I4TTW9_9BACT|nr:enoyl-CoA hydratase-related protein [Thermodesulforhabdus norvegica]SFM80030.1 short chain enoyl-CoA hydratase [Thermodesulforhabdus norvegica]